MSFVTQSEMKLSILPERTSTFCQKIIMIHVQYVRVEEEKSKINFSKGTHKINILLSCNI